MIQQAKFARLPEKKRREILSAIMLNAFSWYSDGKKLIESGSFGHGATLMVFAREEIAKVIGLEAGYLPGVNLEDHKEKHGVLKIQTFGRNPLMDQMQLIKRSIDKLPPGATSEQFSQAVSEANREYLSILLNEPEKSVEFQKMKRRYAVRQHFNKAGVRIREGGLYVDVKDNGDYKSPSELEEETARALMDVTLEDIYFTDILHNDGELSKEYKLDTPYRLA